jgi:polar amino acid transport system substrate-binding protein/cystine transport system substrate-binding protein/membrane-bound lytic murein transglycosylase F
MALVPARLRTPLSYLMIFGLLAGVYLLPADTSLSEVRRAGLLRACMPPAYPPLVTADPAAPGIDVELLRALAEKLALKFAITPNPVMGQDFNPRNWRVTRAQCEVLAGGVVASPVTRSFLETSPSYAETGWGLVLPKPLGDLAGKRAIVFTGISGLDRLALSRFLRSKGIEFTIAPNAAELVSALRDGRADFGVTEMLLAGQLAAREGFSAEWAPAELPRFPVVFGLWKGDLTLKRAIVDGLAQLERSGEMARIMTRYRGGQPGSSKG